MSFHGLQRMFDDSVGSWPDRIAVEDLHGGSISYAELGLVSDQLRDRLRHLGVERGDRVGIYMRKSVNAVASILGTLKAGAAYVPVDPDAPPSRGAYIIDNCAIRVLITERRLADAISAELGKLGAAPAILVIEDATDPAGLRSALADAQTQDPAPPVSNVDTGPEDLAYILYTSGSTGRPKGVMLTHGAARCFIDWCSATFEPSEADVFSSHAPLHFDLSIHDLFVPLKHGARLVVIDEDTGKDPIKLAAQIAGKRISIWYSTPSILSLLATFGKLGRYDFRALRFVLFAGEVFPIPQLRAIKALWPHPRYFNLYGPTETNVCTYLEIPESIPASQVDPFPIGRICPPLEGRVVDESGADVPPGELGELVISGAGVMTGYWNLPDRNERAFLVDASARRWYRTGDLVVEEDGVYVFHGRRDRMVKRRGYRIELGEIEAALAQHPDVREIGVVSLTDTAGSTKILAYVSVPAEQSPSVIAFKSYSADHLPRYMVPDGFKFVPALPRTSTGKVDYQSLLDRAGREASPRAGAASHDGSA